MNQFYDFELLLLFQITPAHLKEIVIDYSGFFQKIKTFYKRKLSKNSKTMT